ncbi:probable polyol transporter 6, partial [Punica granatum]|uniref:Probable polyol transporter 6 n=1 Tax=Punica granatum TaxID=22663 RepID=A0A6P8DAC6_PUNGR
INSLSRNIFLGPTWGVQVPKRTKGSGVSKELFLRLTPAVRHILITSVGIHFLQQASGIRSVLYGLEIFGKAGITDSDHKLLATVGVSLVKSSSILITTFFLDSLGHRPLLLSSIAGTIGFLISIATCLSIINHSSIKLLWAIVLCILSTFSCVAFFSVGMGTVVQVYSSEIFPLRLRAQGCATGSS